MSEPRGDCALQLTTWSEDAAELRAIREAVFIDEQQIPASLEWDAHDGPSLHVLARDPDGRAVGCARLLPDGHIGRVAVLAAWRARGVGTAMIAALVDAAMARGAREVVLHAQVRAVPFYARLGFAPFGDAFDEAGIAHQSMRRRLRDAEG